MEIRRVGLRHGLVEPLLAGLAQEYAQRYGSNISAAEMAAAQPEQFDPPCGAFVVLVDHGTTVAGGGIRPRSGGACEIKRMWTAVGHRRRGHASAVLVALEEAARDLGYTAIKAVTGPAQPEACALYVSSGYRRVAPEASFEGAIGFERDLA